MRKLKNVIASIKGWVLIERPGEGCDGWVNLWLSAKSDSVDREDFLISYNLRTRKFNDCLAWKKLHTAYPATAKWFEMEVRDRYKLTGD